MLKLQRFVNLNCFLLKGLKPLREDEVMAMVESIYEHCTNPGMFIISFRYFSLVGGKKSYLKLTKTNCT